MTDFGKFDAFCRDSSLPVCNLFVHDNQPPGKAYGGCALTGIPLGGDRNLGNLGAIILCGISITFMLFLIALSERKWAAVGRREMQLLLAGYIIVEVCEIFTVGAFPLDDRVRKGFSSVHIAAIAATNWILLMNGLTSLQLRVDGDAIALAFISGTAGLIFICTGYIALDTAFDWTGQFVTTKADGYRNYALYVLYQLFPLVCLVLYFLTQGFTCLVALGEFVPFFFLMIATVLFTLGQVFQYILSRHICAVSGGKINGSIFENFFTLLALASIWILWDNITEDGTENGQQLTP